MTTQQLRLTVNQAEPLPSHYLACFIACNSAPKDWEYKQAFYKLVKEPILNKYGAMAGYDLQIIQKTCWDCQHRPNTGFCHSCNDTGIYSRKEIVLERWMLGDMLFHRPIYDQFRNLGLFNNVIRGLIKHPHAIQCPVTDLIQLIQFLNPSYDIETCMRKINLVY